MMKSLIFSSFCILRSKNTQAVVKWVLKKKKKKNHSLPQCSSSLKTECKESQQPNQSPGFRMDFIYKDNYKHMKNKKITTKRDKLQLSSFLTLSSIASTNGDLLGFIFLTLLPIRNPQNKYKTKKRKITSLLQSHFSTTCDNGEKK